MNVALSQPLLEFHKVPQRGPNRGFHHTSRNFPIFGAQGRSCFKSYLLVKDENIEA